MAASIECGLVLTKFWPSPPIGGSAEIGTMPRFVPVLANSRNLASIWAELLAKLWAELCANSMDAAPTSRMRTACLTTSPELYLAEAPEISTVDAPRAPPKHGPVAQGRTQRQPSGAKMDGPGLGARHGAYRFSRCRQSDSSLRLPLFHESVRLPCTSSHGGWRVWTSGSGRCNPSRITRRWLARTGHTCGPASSPQ